MAKFLLLFIGKKLDSDKNNVQADEYMRKWLQWMQDLIISGTFDSGLPLASSGKRAQLDAIAEYDPPEFDVGGYMVINALSLEEACKLAQGAPTIEFGGEVILRPCLEIAG